ncbi:MAG: hypothetical protein D6721_06585 [Gammaproteobacteria bacterium]|nr:MAG: hypothetical protein D6721_06585 [Gammaproteobacteria bacterium]
MNPGAARQRGAALLLVILLLVLGSLHFVLVSSGAHDVHREADRAAAYLRRLREALVGHALETGCLPCPSPDPTRGTAPARCPRPGDRDGYVPWQTLGVEATDPWGSVVRYRVSGAYAEGDCRFSAGTRGTLEVATREPDGRVRVLEPAAPFVLFSPGPNRLGGRRRNGRAAPPPPRTHVDERINLYDARRFRTRPWTEDPAAAGGPFDDLVAWISPDRLCRLLAHRKGWSCP